jgi:hypothetical protein
VGDVEPARAPRAARKATSSSMHSSGSHFHRSCATRTAGPSSNSEEIRRSRSR